VDLDKTTQHNAEEAPMDRDPMHRNPDLAYTVIDFDRLPGAPVVLNTDDLADAQAAKAKLRHGDIYDNDPDEGGFLRA
jgi:hypothetical protein